jgi:hypothetical protein
LSGKKTINKSHKKYNGNRNPYTQAVDRPFGGAAIFYKVESTSEEAN